MRVCVLSCLAVSLWVQFQAFAEPRLVEKTAVDGVLNSVHKGIVVRTTSGSAYEITNNVYGSVGRVSPNVTVLEEDGHFTLLIDGVANAVSCRRLVSHSVAVPSSTSNTWQLVEDTYIRGRESYLLKEGVLLEMASGSKYEVLGVVGSAYLSQRELEDGVKAAVFLSGERYRVRVGKEAECLCKRLQAGPVNPVAAAKKDATPQEALVLIEGKRGKGSGFLARLGDKKYLVTNEHVLRTGAPLRCREVAGGRDVSFLSIELCRDRDLVRLELKDQSLPAVNVTSQVPDIGELVSVYGNDLGLGVVRSMGDPRPRREIVFRRGSDTPQDFQGMVKGIGPDRVEVTTKLTPGVSGGPMFTRQDNVFAVSTYSVTFPAYASWIVGNAISVVIVEGEKRYYGVRIPLADTNAWIAITDAEYFKRCDALQDIDLYVTQVRDVVFKKLRDRNASSRIDYPPERNAEYIVLKGLPVQIASFAKKWNMLVTTAESHARGQSAIGTTGFGAGSHRRIGETLNRSDTGSTFDQQNFVRNYLREKIPEIAQEFRGLYKAVETPIVNTNWIAPGLEEEARQYLDYMKGMFQDVNGNR